MPSSCAPDAAAAACDVVAAAWYALPLPPNAPMTALAAPAILPTPQAFFRMSATLFLRGFRYALGFLNRLLFGRGACWWRISRHLGFEHGRKRYRGFPARLQAVFHLKAGDRDLRLLVEPAVRLADVVAERREGALHRKSTISSASSMAGKLMATANNDAHLFLSDRPPARGGQRQPRARPHRTLTGQSCRHAGETRTEIGSVARLTISVTDRPRQIGASDTAITERRSRRSSARASWSAAQSAPRPPRRHRRRRSASCRSPGHRGSGARRCSPWCPP